MTGQEVQVKIKIKTVVRARHNRPNSFVYDKRKREITLIEVGRTHQDTLQPVKVERKRRVSI